MASLNKIILIGRLASDPELKYTEGGGGGGGLAMTTFTLAVDRPFSKSSGQAKKTDFFRCKAWRQKAEFVSQWVQKGRLVAVEGRVELNEYTGQDGQRRFFTDIVVDQVETLDSPRDRAGEAAPPGGGYSGGRPADSGFQGPDHGYDDGGYQAEDAGQRMAPSRPAAAAPAPRPAAPAPRPAPAPARPAPRPVPAQAAYPADDDFDDSDPFADE